MLRATSSVLPTFHQLPPQGANPLLDKLEDRLGGREVPVQDWSKEMSGHGNPYDCHDMDKFIQYVVESKAYQGPVALDVVWKWLNAEVPEEDSWARAWYGVSRKTREMYETKLHGNKFMGPRVLLMECAQEALDAYEMTKQGREFAEAIAAFEDTEPETQPYDDSDEEQEPVVFDEDVLHECEEVKAGMGAKGKKRAVERSSGVVQPTPVKRKPFKLAKLVKPAVVTSGLGAAEQPYDMKEGGAFNPIEL